MAAPDVNPAVFRPVDYRDAAAERLADVDLLVEHGHFGPALYLAGVAAECAIRSRFAVAAAFDGRHDLMELAKASDIVPTNLAARQAVVADIQLLRHLWRNSYRYMTPGKIGLLLEAIRYKSALQGRNQRLRAASLAAREAARRLFQRALVASAPGSAR